MNSQSKEMPFNIDTECSIGNTSNTSFKYYMNNSSHIYTKNPEMGPKANQISSDYNKPREMPKRLYNNRDDIFLPHVSRERTNNRKRLMQHLYFYRFNCLERI